MTSTNRWITTLSVILALLCLGSPALATDRYTRLPAWEHQLGCPAYLWAPETNEPKAVVILVHGFVLHATCFDAFATALAQDGIAVASVDLRGFGPRQTTTTGTVIPIDFEKSCDDFRSLVSLVRQQFPGVPVFVGGESIGAEVAALVAASDESLSGLLLASPAYKVKRGIALRCGGSLLAKTPVANRALDVSKCVRRYISNMPDVKADVERDPEIRTEYSRRDALYCLKFLSKAGRAYSNVPNRMPVIVIEPSRETLLNVDGYAVFKKIPAASKSLHIFQNDGHLLLECSPARPEMVTVLTNWINRMVQYNGERYQGRLATH